MRQAVCAAVQLVSGKRGDLRTQAGGIRLPSETSHCLRAARIAGQIRAAADAVAIGIVRVGVFEDGGVGHQFQQTHAVQRWRHAQRSEHARGQWAVARIAELQPRGAQSVLLREAHDDAAFARYARDAVLVELPAVVRFGHGRAAAGHGQTHQRAPQALVNGFGRITPAVGGMAGDAGLLVEQRPESVAGGVGGGRWHQPFTPEHEAAMFEAFAVGGSERQQRLVEDAGDGGFGAVRRCDESRQQHRTQCERAPLHHAQAPPAIVAAAAR
jgi:hypothetical protein